MSKSSVTEEFPFNENTLVYKVAGKMFALTDVDSFESVNIKCDPVYAIELCEKYNEVIPGYHMNKKHWITILMSGSVTDDILFSWIDNSYNLVVSKLTKKEKSILK